MGRVRAEDAELACDAADLGQWFGDDRLGVVAHIALDDGKPVRRAQHARTARLWHVDRLGHARNDFQRQIIFVCRLNLQNADTITVVQAFPGTTGNIVVVTVSGRAIVVFTP
jgi:hypothetical protein